MFWTRMLTIRIPGRLVPWARVRASGKRRYTAPRVAGEKRRLASLAASALPVGWDPSGEMQLALWVCRRRKWTATPDADNLAKIVMDAWNGLVWLDDSQIVALHVYKLDSRDAGVSEGCVAMVSKPCKTRLVSRFRQLVSHE